MNKTLAANISHAGSFGKNQKRSFSFSRIITFECMKFKSFYRIHISIRLSANKQMTKGKMQRAQPSASHNIVKQELFFLFAVVAI